MKLDDLSLKELLNYENALKIIIQHYDNSIRLHDNSFYHDSESSVKKLVYYGRLHNEVIEKIEEKIAHIV